MKSNTHALRAPPILAAALSLIGISGSAAAQPNSAARPIQNIDRQRRFDELEQLQLDNRLRANQDVPVGQRALIDYGGYVTLQYFSIDDRANDNHGLFQPDLVLYGRVNLDAANEVFVNKRDN